MSASASKSMCATFSSHRTTSCCGGVSAATVGSARFGKTHFFPRLGRMRSNVQNDSGFFGATSKILMARLPGSHDSRRACLSRQDLLRLPRVAEEALDHVLEGLAGRQRGPRSDHRRIGAEI